MFNPNCRTAIARLGIYLLVGGAATAFPGYPAAAAPGLELNRESVAGTMKVAAPRIPISPVDSAAGGLQKPRRFAVGIATDITPDANGSWTRLADGRWLWRMRIESPGAKSLSFAISHLRLPAQAELYVYDAQGRVVHGPFTSLNERRNSLWTPIVPADAAVLEVLTPAEKREELELQISTVYHGFAKPDAPLMGESGACEVDIACSAGDQSRDEGRSVAVYTFAGEFSCTGILVNNTAKDRTPYFLTAAHCIENAEQAASIVVYWNYQASTCGADDGALEQNQAGADLVARSETDARHGGSDFALLKLWEKPDPSFNVYYSGWDRRDIAPSSGVVGIHHPNGDRKKISRSDLATFTDSLEGAYRGYGFADDAPTHLFIRGWTVGAVEFGSSGSGLWNSDHRLVGHLSIGGWGCDAPADHLPDGYGRLYHDWSASDNPKHSVATYLDPQKSGVEVLDGMDAVVPASDSAPSAVAGGGSFGHPTLIMLGLFWLVKRRCLR